MVDHTAVETSLQGTPRMQVPGGTGEILLRIMESMQPLLTTSKLSLSSIEERTVSLCKALTGASWVEVIIEEKESLRILGRLQNVSVLEVDENSLPGYSALHATPQVINNPNTSTFYAAFKYKLHPYSILSKQRQQSSSIACIPILEEGRTKAVLMLFNKVDDSKMFSFFTENDIFVIQSIGISLLSALHKLRLSNRLRNKINLLKKHIAEERKIVHISLQSDVKKQLLGRCKRILTDYKAVTEDVIRVMGDVMESDGILFHLIVDSSLIPLIESGLSYTDKSQLFTKTAEFVAFNSKEILNIEELVSEPLWENTKLFRGRALLTCPIFNRSEEVVGVLEFFRTSRVFTSHDRKIAGNLLEHMRNITTDRCIPTVKNLPIPESPLKSSTVEAIYAEVSSLYTFSLDVDALYDYAGVLEELSLRAKSLLNIENCTVYIADQKMNILWTQKSESCDPLMYPLGSDTLFGLAFRNKSVVEFPEAGLAISDSESFENQHVLCVPLLGKFLANGAIGLLVLSKQDQGFSEIEKKSVNFISPLVREILEMWFVGSLQEMEAPAGDFFPSDTNFTAANQYYQNTNIRRLSAPPLNSINEMESKPLHESLSYVLSIASIPQNRIFELKRALNDIMEDPEHCLKILSQRLSQIVPCQKACLLMIDSADQHIIDIYSGTLVKASGLIHQCILKKQVICLRTDVGFSTFFDPHVDCLGLDHKIENYLAVPILNLIDSVLGVFVFVNASINFGEEDIALAQFLSLIPREFVFTKDDNMKNLQSILKIGRRHKMLQHWCKQIFFVANSTQQNMTIAQDILHRLFENDENLEELIQASLEIICVTLNAEKASLVLKENNEFYEKSLENGSISKSPLKKDDELLIKAIDLDRPISDNSRKEKYENLLIVPLVESKKRVFALKAMNKRDESLTYYCNFTKLDELVLTDFIKAIASATNNPEDKDSYTPLIQLIRHSSTSMNTNTLISTIRSASQKLLDCDRATVFIKEGNFMVVKAQGIENEMPGGFSVPIGKGIIGNVAQTAQVENIKDVYSDARFNSEVDKRTGYKTSTMLCMPVLDTHGKVIAALQMINKRQGYFDDSDEETLEIFCEIISTVLTNWNTFQRNIEEKNRYLNILNSLGTYILIFSEEGKLMYCNKSIDDVFGVDEKAARQSHYSSWLRTNRQLVYDITTVQQGSSKKINRTAQRISILTLKRTRTYTSSIRSFNYLNEKELVFNYTVASIQDYFNVDKFGIVLILEDTTNFQELNLKFSKIQEEIQAIKNPVHTETPLQKCIEKLQHIESNSENLEIAGQIQEIISVLKKGNLNKIEVTFAADINTISDHLKKALAEYTEIESSHHLEVAEPTRKVSRNVETEDLSSIMTELREINLEVFEVTDYFTYISSMLRDFDLINQFEIGTTVLSRFVNEVKEQYQVFNNPYHNFVHGFNVMHITYLLLVSSPASSLYTAHDILALLVGSLCHDVQHTGRTNAFEINRQSHLAIVYNDQSVLENHHAAMTFKILQNEKTNIFTNINPETLRSMRKLMIYAILMTDMSQHFPMIGRINLRLKDAAEKPIGSDLDDGKDFGGLLVHAADLGHPCARLDIYQKWSTCVCEEFTRQYREELEMGLPATELMKDLHKPEVYYDKEHGFLNFVVLPLWKVMDLWLRPHINQFLEHLNSNIEVYAERKESFKIN